MIKKDNKKDKYVIDLSNVIKNQKYGVETLSEITKIHAESSLKILQESIIKMLEVADNSQKIFQESIIQNLKL